MKIVLAWLGVLCLYVGLMVAPDSGSTEGVRVVEVISSLGLGVLGSVLATVGFYNE